MRVCHSPPPRMDGVGTNPLSTVGLDLYQLKPSPPPEGWVKHSSPCGVGLGLGYTLSPTWGQVGNGPRSPQPWGAGPCPFLSPGTWATVLPSTVLGWFWAMLPFSRRLHHTLSPLWTKLGLGHAALPPWDMVRTGPMSFSLQGWTTPSPFPCIPPRPTGPGWNLDALCPPSVWLDGALPQAPYVGLGLSTESGPGTGWSLPI